MIKNTPSQAKWRDSHQNLFLNERYTQSYPQVWGIILRADKSHANDIKCSVA